MEKKLLRLVGFIALALAVTIAFAGTKNTSWDQYGGPGGQQYTDLDQIKAANLGQLEQAWVMRTGDLNQGFKYKRHSFQANPVFWNNMLYISTSANWVIAVNASTGDEVWRFDPKLRQDIGYSESASRGVSIWHGNSETCPDRIFAGTLVGHLYALNATTGELCSDFGVGGKVDMSVGVGDVDIGDYGITSPPAVMENQIIVGSAIGDNRAVKSERGIVRALDARTGAIKWLWDPIPRSDTSPAYSSWEGDSSISAGSANAWAPISVDVSRKRVYISTSSPSPDFFGGERKGDNNYANSIVSLNSDTGEVVWHQQLVHHDVWDYDVPSQPTLTELRIKGELIPAVVVVTKTGMLYAFNRDTGVALYDIVEKVVPQSDVPGERLSATQPFSSIPPLVSHKALTGDDAFGLAWFDKRGCRKILETFRSEGIFTPPSLEGSILSPSYAGGSNWGGVAIDPERQIAIANVNQFPALVRLIPRDKLESIRNSGELDGWDISRQKGTPYYMARRIFLSSLGLPCTAPPWGKLVAVDLAAGEILWGVPLGTIKNLAPAAVPNFKWGVPNMGGPLVTKSGLVVIGAAAEHVFRIFDIRTGKELWQQELPAAAMATPMSYEVEGVQYIAVAVGGHDQMGLEKGDYLMSFRIKQ